MIGASRSRISIANPGRSHPYQHQLASQDLGWHLTPN